jgi:hypothetical protein
MCCLRLLVPEEQDGERTPDRTPVSQAIPCVGYATCPRSGRREAAHPHAHTPTRPHAHTPTRPHAHTPTRPHAYTPTRLHAYYQPTPRLFIPLHSSHSASHYTAHTPHVTLTCPPLPTLFLSPVDRPRCCHAPVGGSEGYGYGDTDASYS